MKNEPLFDPDPIQRQRDIAAAFEILSKTRKAIEEADGIGARPADASIRTVRVDYDIQDPEAIVGFPLSEDEKKGFFVGLKPAGWTPSPDEYAQLKAVGEQMMVDAAEKAMESTGGGGIEHWILKSGKGFAETVDLDDFTRDATCDIREVTDSPYEVFRRLDSVAADPCRASITFCDDFSEDAAKLCADSVGQHVVTTQYQDVTYNSAAPDDADQPIQVPRE